MLGPGAPAVGGAAHTHPAPHTYRERQVLLGLLLGGGLGLGLGGHHGHRRRLGGGGDGWGRGGRQGRGGRRGCGRCRAEAAVVQGRPLLELCRQRGAGGAGLLGGPAGLQAGFPGRRGCKQSKAWGAAGRARDPASERSAWALLPAAGVRAPGGTSGHGAHAPESPSREPEGSGLLRPAGKTSRR